ncbi:Octaprenyl diphosphate synthase (plasmid) [Sinorhizobium fredii CCBAU 25509]|nr:Octaprenyl diphosphate synthase [Sinorhizobium fredii CCBAU 25509]
MDMLLNPLDRRHRLRYDIPVVPGAFPLVGHLPAIVCDLPRLLRRAERTLGSHFWLDFGPAGHLMTCVDPDAFALLRHKDVSSALIEEIAPELLGGTLVAQDGGAHRQARDAIKAALLPKGLTQAGIGALFAPVIRARVQAWRDRGDVAILRETGDLMLKLIFRLMGIPAQDLPGWHRKYRQLLQLIVAPPVDLPGLPLRRGRAARDWIDARLRQFVRDARAHAARTGLINDMVSAFDRSDDALSDDVLVANIRLLLLAGHDTTASTMAWMVIELARQPVLWDALVEEAQRVGAAPTRHEDLAQCPVAEALFRETLRVHPAITLLPRRALQELQLGQRRIPAAPISHELASHAPCGEAAAPAAADRRSPWPSPVRYKDMNNMQTDSTLHDDRTGVSALGGGASGRLLPEIWMQDGAKRVEQALARLLCAEDDGETELMAAMRYATLHGGKRTRALLCLAAGALADTPAHMLDDVGAAIEMMHACTLVHDDLPAMDDDVLRRGLPTVHVRFGEATAILVGDALQAHAFLTLASLDAPGDNRIALVRELARAVSAEGAAGGQAMDLSLVGKHVELDRIVAMHRMKCGALVRASVRMGALCAIAEDAAHAALYCALDRYSACFGLALQVVDDILDATADTATLGKTPGKDAAGQKPTCASIIGLQAARQFALDLLRDAGEAIAPLGPRAERMAQMLQRANAYLFKHAPCA